MNIPGRAAVVGGGEGLSFSWGSYSGRQGRSQREGVVGCGLPWERYEPGAGGVDMDERSEGGSARPWIGEQNTGGFFMGDIFAQVSG